MKDYIDLVLARIMTPSETLFVLKAPFNSCLKKGDMVIVEADTGVYSYTVEKVLSCSLDSDEYAFIRELNGNEFIRITSTAKKFDYSDEDYMKGIE